MNPKHRFVFAGLLLAAVAGLWFLMQQSGAPAVPSIPETLPVTADPTPLQAPLQAETTPALAGPDRKEVAATADLAQHPELDPDVAAALTGFKGRVVDHRKQPVANAKFVLLRISTDSVMPPETDLMAGTTVEPDVDAGEARTDAEGRFEIHGVWPHGLYLGSAGRDGEHPTMRLVDETPGPGEIVDLGDFVLRHGATLTGKVVDEEGKPIAGALVRAADLPAIVTQFVPIEQIDPAGAVIVREARSPVVVTPPAWAARRFEQLPIPRTTTAADGTFRLAGIEPGENMLAVTSTGRQSLVRPGIRLDPGEEEALGTLTLREGEEVYGKVVDDRGKPIPGAEVLLAQTSSTVPVDFAGPPIRAGDDGTFMLTGFKSGKVTAATRRDPGDAWTVFDPKQTSEDLVLTLPAVCTLTVHVRDEKGEPIPSARLQVLPNTDGSEPTLGLALFGMIRPLELRGRLGKDDETGAIVVRGLPRGSYIVRADAPGMATEDTGVKLDGDQTAELKLQRNHVFDVLVADGRGTPVRGASVYAMVRGGMGPNGDIPIHCGRTDAAGRLQVNRLRCERIAVSASHPKYGSADAQATLPVEQPIKITLATPGAIEGVLTDGGRQPDPGKFMVTIVRSGMGAQAMPSMPRFTLPVLDGKFQAKGLQPGSYRVLALESLRAVTSFGSGFQTVTNLEAGFEPNVITVEVKSGETTQVTLEADPAAQPIDGPSAPLAGIVTVNGLPPKDAYMQIWQQKRRTAQLDAAGRFDFGQVPAGEVNLTLRARSGGLFGSNQEIWEGQIELKPGEPRNLELHIVTSEIEGTVLGPDGMPVPLAGVMVMGQPEPAKDGGTTRSGGTHRWVSADASGRYRAENLLPGKYSLRAQHDRAGIGTREDVVLRGGTPQLGVDIRLERTMKLTGRVEFSDRTEFRYASLNLNGHPEGKPDQNLHAWGRVDEDGTFEVTNAAPGVYDVRAWVQRQGENNDWSQYECAQKLTVPNHDLENLRFVLSPQQPRQRGR